MNGRLLDGSSICFVCVTYIPYTYGSIIGIHTYIHTYIHTHMCVSEAPKQNNDTHTHIHPCIYTYIHGNSGWGWGIEQDLKEDNATEKVTNDQRKWLKDVARRELGGMCAYVCMYSLHCICGVHVSSRILADAVYLCVHVCIYVCMCVYVTVGCLCFNRIMVGTAAVKDRSTASEICHFCPNQEYVVAFPCLPLSEICHYCHRFS